MPTHSVVSACEVTGVDLPDRYAVTADQNIGNGAVEIGHRGPELPRYLLDPRQPLLAPLLERVIKKRTTVSAIEVRDITGGPKPNDALRPWAARQPGRFGAAAAGLEQGDWHVQ